IIMADSDDSYDFEHLEDFVLRLRGGSDLVMGNRFKGGIEPGAMPFLHKFLGNPVLSFLGRLFFNIKIGDFHCGLRGFNREKILRLKLKTTGMEFASEMIVKSAQYNYSITEIPTKLKQDGRSRPPHLNTWRDGWRHLRFLLMAAPNWLFLLPGLLFCFTSLLSLFFIPNFCQLLNLKEQQFIMSTVGMFIVGFQMIVFYFFAKIFTITQGIVPTTNRYMNLFKYFNLERGLLFSVFLIISGICTIIYLDTRTLLNWHVGLLEIVLGLQLILNSFMFSIIGTVKKEQIQ
ncbi:MAG: glycosyltransferase family 2 protein, partial [Bacteroidetes bacterium]|nr:glycosyltransferase family 2 protein [Bacteroidota bacterium]